MAFQREWEDIKTPDEPGKNLDKTLNLQSLDLRVTYRSVDSDILNEFYIPCLQNSVIYRRAVGYFTSASLAEAARGLVDFVENEGKMDLIASPRLTQKDIVAIEEGYKLREVVQRALKRGLDQQLSEADLTRVKNLTWMIANGKLDIKIAVPKSKEDEGIYHEKIGIFYDPLNNIVAFSGSLNETAWGLISNYESIDVSVSWDDGERERHRVRDHVQHFDRLWKATAPGLTVMEFPEAVQRVLLEKYEPTKPVREPHKRRRLYSFQQTAIKAWEGSGYKGVLAMATGSGKTYTAIKALELCKELKLTLVVVPSIDLVNQWEKEIREEYGQNCIVRRVHSKEKEWKSRTERLVEAVVNDVTRKRAFVVTTVHTASRPKFIQAVRNFPREFLGIIVDEVHHAGAPVFRNVFDINTRFRIGLSATPDREWDEEGNQAIFDYFGQVVFEYSISHAIADGVLSNYYYHPHIVSLNYEEKEAFNEISRSIATATAQAHSEHPSTRRMTVPRMLQYLDSVNSVLSPRLRTLFLRRVEIVKKAENKFEAFREIIKKHQLKRCLVYCNDLQHLDDNVRIVHEEGLEPIEFSSRIEPDMRKRILKSFEENVEQNTLLLAVKCLDEGVDIPACDSAVLIACSRSTREFIQRRGRVLRRHPTKEFSVIHDIVVLPFSDAKDAYPITASEYGFVKEELRRIQLLSRNALNKDDLNVEQLIDLCQKNVLY